MYLCAQNHDLKRGGTFETAKAGTFHSVTAGTSIPLFTDYLNDVISQMPYHTKASHEELLQLLPQKWKLTHPESVMTKTK